MKVIGLTGSIASGKSLIARHLAGLGANVIDTDIIARQVVEKGSIGLKRIEEQFGKGFITNEGNLNRQAMRERIFVDPEAKDRLNAITHPLILERCIELILEAEKAGDKAVVLEVPLLFESGFDRLCDETWNIYCNEDLQISRLKARDGVDDNMAKLMISSQMPADERNRMATHVIENNGELKMALSQAEKLFEQTMI